MGLGNLFQTASFGLVGGSGDGSGLSETLFGDQGKGAAESQERQNEENRRFIAQQAEQARGDIFNLIPAAETNRQLGTQAALDIFGQTIPQQLDVFQRGNVGAQQALTQGLPQIQAALLGQPVDFGQIQPQSISFNTDFAQQRLPDFISTQQAIPAANPENQQLIQQALEMARRTQSGEFDNTQRQANIGQLLAGGR
jgi:hypothetical protein